MKREKLCYKKEEKKKSRNKMMKQDKRPTRMLKSKQVTSQECKEKLKQTCKILMILKQLKNLIMEIVKSTVWHPKLNKKSKKNNSKQQKEILIIKLIVLSQMKYRKMKRNMKMNHKRLTQSLFQRCKSYLKNQESKQRIVMSFFLQKEKLHKLWCRGQLKLVSLKLR